MSFLKYEWSFLRKKKMSSLHTKMFYQVYFRLAQLYWRRKVYKKKASMYCPEFVIIPPFKGCDPSFESHESFSTDVSQCLGTIFYGQ